MSPIEARAFRSPAELAVACQQWIDIGCSSEAARYAQLAFRMARVLSPRALRALEAL